MRAWTTAGLILALGLINGCGTAPAATTDRGAVAFENYCSPCHGTNAGGDARYAAPAVAGLPQWYVEAQIHKFRDGVRGAHHDDHEGLRMRPMSRTLSDAEDVAAVSGYIASLSAPREVPTLQGGDAKKGKGAYATCSACHGQDGKGNEALKAPPLVQQQDWYLLTQIKKFKEGIRGRNPKDTTGLQMAPMAATLPDEQAMLDVVAHIQTLN